MGGGNELGLFKTYLRTVFIYRYHILLDFQSLGRVSVLLLASREQCARGGAPQVTGLLSHVWMEIPAFPLSFQPSRWSTLAQSEWLITWLLLLDPSPLPFCTDLLRIHRNIIACFLQGWPGPSCLGVQWVNLRVTLSGISVLLWIWVVMY